MITPTDADRLVERHAAINNYDVCRRESSFRERQLGHAQAAAEEASANLEIAVEGVARVMLDQGLHEITAPGHVFRLDADDRLTVEKCSETGSQPADGSRARQDGRPVATSEEEAARIGYFFGR